MRKNLVDWLHSWLYHSTIFFKIVLQYGRCPRCEVYLCNVNARIPDNIKGRQLSIEERKLSEFGNFDFCLQLKPSWHFHGREFPCGRGGQRAVFLEKDMWWYSFTILRTPLQVARRRVSFSGIVTAFRWIRVHTIFLTTSFERKSHRRKKGLPKRKRSVLKTLLTRQRSGRYHLRWGRQTFPWKELHKVSRTLWCVRWLHQM